MRRATPSRRGFPAATTLAAAGAILAACAAPLPATVEPAFVDPSPPAARKAAGDCALNVVEVIDLRRSPETLGVISNRALKAPEDIPGWLRSVIGGLGTHGFTVGFADPAAPAEAVVVKARLQTAWITETRGNKTANVVLLVAARRGDRELPERAYRGAVSIINWAGGADEIRDVLDRAFSDALDDVARDIRPLCPA